MDRKGRRFEGRKRKRTQFLGVIDLGNEGCGSIAETVYDITGVVAALFGHGVYQPSTRVHSANEDIEDSVTRLLARKTSVQDRGYVRVVIPWLDDDGPDDMHDDDGVGTVRWSVENELITAVPEIEVVPVTRVALHRQISFT